MNKVFQDLFSGDVVYQDRSEINGLIKVVKVFNQPRLMVGGMIQSGGLVRKIWDKGIKKIKREECQIDKALILGFGGGDCAFKLEQYYPMVKITGVELDRKIVEACENYFKVKKLKNLKMVIDDGLKFVSETKNKYDLIVIDVYVGQGMPKGFRTKVFFRQVKRRLNKNGTIIFNHLFFGEYKEMAERLIKTLEPEFNKIRLMRVASNLLILASG
jgi:predicted membrane-bound spermidine synthase